MWNDSIVEEVRKVRDEHAARFDYDLERIFQDLKEQERKRDQKVVSFPPKRPLKNNQPRVARRDKRDGHSLGQDPGDLGSRHEPAGTEGV